VKQPFVLFAARDPRFEEESFWTTDLGIIVFFIGFFISVLVIWGVWDVVRKKLGIKRKIRTGVTDGGHFGGHDSAD
tara:strand:+ start:224 stop:451 length:228 start_codon:yes stop_codon:yes gene_type:complete